MFKKAGPLIDYSKHSFSNTYGLTNISFDKKIHTYCRLGGDVYTNNLHVSFNPGNMVPDYVYLNKAIVERFEKTDSIIEEVLAGVVEIIKNQCPNASDIVVSSFVNDSVPQDMPLTVTVRE